MLHRFILAIKVFWKAFRNPSAAEVFLLPSKENAKSPLPKDENPSHLRLLALLQHSGRLIDFLKEEIDTFSDAQVGAAVRQVHSACKDTLEELITIRPILDSPEGSKITINAGYDATAIRLVGNVPAAPPYAGVVVHPGWKAHKLSMPKQSGIQHSSVLSAAEIEVR